MFPWFLFLNYFSWFEGWIRVFLECRIKYTATWCIISLWKLSIAWIDYKENLLMISPSCFFYRGLKWCISRAKDLCRSSWSIWLLRTVRLHTALILSKNNRTWERRYLISWSLCEYAKSLWDFQDTFKENVWFVV